MEKGKSKIDSLHRKVAIALSILGISALKRHVVQC